VNRTAAVVAVVASKRDKSGDGGPKLSLKTAGQVVVHGDNLEVNCMATVVAVVASNGDQQ